MNTLFTAWVETVYHRRTHSETGQTPIQRWSLRLTRRAMPPPAQLREAFLWSEWRTVTKTATVGLHGNHYEVDTALAGRKVELVFDPFDLTRIEVRYHDKGDGQEVRTSSPRHTHPKAKPEMTELKPPRTGIDYLSLTAAAHHEQLRRDERIGYHALYSGCDDGRSPTSYPSTMFLASTQRARCRREYPTAAITLGVHPDAVRARPGASHAARAMPGMERRWPVSAGVWTNAPSG